MKFKSIVYILLFISFFFNYLDAGCGSCAAWMLVVPIAQRDRRDPDPGAAGAGVWSFGLGEVPMAIGRRHQHQKQRPPGDNGEPKQQRDPDALRPPP